MGAFVPLAPYLVAVGATAAWAAVVLALSSLFGVGALMSRFTGRPLLLSGGRMLLIGGGAALLTFAVGNLLGGAVG